MGSFSDAFRAKTNESDYAPPHAVVLAAGMGTRMKSDLPKVLVPCAGRPLLGWVLDALERADIRTIIVVVGYQGERVFKAFADRPRIAFVNQSPPLGTGHAVACCRFLLEKLSGPTVVVAGDSPLVQPSSLRRLIEHFVSQTATASPNQARLACLLGTLYHPNPQGLGRIVRDPHTGEFLRIVEEREATEQERALCEVNMSTYVFHTPALVWALERLRNDNVKKEYYLTDCPKLLKDAGWRIEALPVLEPCEALSVNTPEELAAAEAELLRQHPKAKEPAPSPASPKS